MRVKPWTLGLLAKAIGGSLRDDGGARDRTVRDVHEDSRRCGAGSLFVAMPGHHADGLAFVQDARSRGAFAVVSERDPGRSVPWLKVEDVRGAVGRLADLVYDDPSLKIPMVGVTGTNGKTTIAHLVSCLVGSPVGVIGTLGVSCGGRVQPTANTTPGPTELRRRLREMVAAGCQAAVMEVSSHALHQRRVEGLRFDVAVYSNLSGEHLDYHGDMEAYAAAKAILFRSLPPEAVAVLNRKDPACAAIETDAQIRWFDPVDVKTDAHGLSFRWKGRSVRSPLLGVHNAQNAAAALEAVCALGMDPDLAVRKLAEIGPATGRLEPVQREPSLVLVDYAHTDDALDKALMAVRGMTRGRVLVVFGCGGDRDRGKRPRMGKVAARWADRIFVTNDNPRNEDPERIAREIRTGLEDAGAQDRATTCLDRRSAIGRALDEARPGDAVLIAGKGHEREQIVGGEVLPFDDAHVAREFLGSEGPRS